jgi:hypothetical protein
MAEKRTFSSEKIKTHEIELVQGPALISGDAPTGYFAELIAQTGHFDDLYCGDVSVCSGILRPQVEYGFWLSGCNTEHLYLDIGTGTSLGHDPHAYHVSGYRCSFMNITGIDVHITGLNESGLLTIEYPDR